MRIFKKLCLYVIFTTVIQSAQSAEITHINVGDISIKGQIVPGDFKKFYDLVQSFGDVREIMVRLDNSPGGDLLESVEIGKVVRAQKMKTWVPEKTLCTSGCAIIWIAGARRSSTLSSLIGFHTPFAPVTGQKDKSTVVYLSNYYTQLGIQR